MFVEPAVSCSNIIDSDISSSYYWLSGDPQERQCWYLVPRVSATDGFSQ